ncbi:MAG: crossover junction endodeoxyribonuclease RuvC, partial [Candidatus Peribacteraceae bacterium]|nr:crossover junction endodeoxyribonuclease RuvC [Candidatus Peribacteraceae bacterium]
QNRTQIGAAIKLAMLASTIRMALYEAKMPFYVISPGQIKKYVTGKGNAPKSIIVREVFKRWGLEVKDDNQADACTLAFMAAALVDIPAEMPKFQEEVLTKVINDRPRFNV